MQQDPSVVVIGQDVGANGGVFRATVGLQQRFGRDRVQDTPLAEATIAGMAVGMAAHGLKPVAEIQFMGFMYPALDQIVNHMSRMRYRTRGRLHCPVVIRMPHGGGIHAPEHHSESTETMLCHMPGIRVVCPSSPARAYGLLLAAIRDPDPVMFLEPVRLYRAMRQDVGDDGLALALDTCFTLRPGTDVTIVTWGAMTLETLSAVGGARQGGHQRRSHRPGDLESDRRGRDSRLGGQDRAPDHRSRGGAQRRRRRGNRGDRRRARALRSARTDSAGHRLRYHHAALPAGKRLHSLRQTHHRRGSRRAGRLKSEPKMNTFKLPDLGEGLAEAEIVEWHVKVGDRVVIDQPMVSVETAKAVVEVPAPYGGIVAALHAAAGDIVPTGAPLIDLDSDSGTVVGSMPAGGAEELIEAAEHAHDHSNGVQRGDGRGRAVPVARALAKRLGVDLDTIEGTGRGGLITLDDVLQHARVPASPLKINKLAARTGTEPAPLRGSRRAMAHTMSRARDEIALSTVCDDADVEAWTPDSNFTLRLMRAIVCAWRVEPALNAWYDPADNSRLLLKHVDLGVAVDTPGGLLVPVLRNVESKSPEELRAALTAQKRPRNSAAPRRRICATAPSCCRTSARSPAVMVSPQVVPPTVAILGAGKVRRDAVVVGDAVVAHRRMPLSLSFDHRCVTGGEACRFLAAVIADLEKPL